MSEDVITHTFELPPPSTAAQRMRAFDAIADHMVRTPRALRTEEPKAALGPIIAIIDRIGPPVVGEEIDSRDEVRLRAFDEIARIVTNYLPPDGGEPADALNRIEQVILDRRARAAAA